MTWPFENDTGAIVEKLSGRSIRKQQGRKYVSCDNDCSGVCFADNGSALDLWYTEGIIDMTKENAQMPDFRFRGLGGPATWIPYAMIGACVVAIPLFAFLAVRSYCGHTGNWRIEKAPERERLHREVASFYG